MDALRDAGLEPLTLEPKEGLALINGTQLMTASERCIAADASVAAHGVGRRGDVASRRCAGPRSRSPRRISCAARTRARSPWGRAPTPLRGSGLQRSHHDSATRFRTRIRCAACRRSTAPSATRSATAARVLDIEPNSATDNPLVFPLGGSVPEDALATGGGPAISGGNFHGEPIALALDFAKLALAELGSISERRPPDDVRADRRRGARHPARGRRGAPRRHRQVAVRARHLRQPLDARLGRRGRGRLAQGA